MASNLGPGFGSSSKNVSQYGNQGGSGGHNNFGGNNMGQRNSNRNVYGANSGGMAQAPGRFGDQNPRMGSGMRDDLMGGSNRNGGQMMSGRGGAFDENSGGGVLGSIASKRMAVRRGRGDYYFVFII